MKLINTTTHETLAIIHGSRLTITHAGEKACLVEETIRVPTCNIDQFEGREWIEPGDRLYAAAFYLFVTTSVMKNRSDLEWEKEPSDLQYNESE